MSPPIGRNNPREEPTDPFSSIPLAEFHGFPFPRLKNPPFRGEYFCLALGRDRSREGVFFWKHNQFSDAPVLKNYKVPSTHAGTLSHLNVTAFPADLVKKSKNEKLALLLKLEHPIFYSAEKDFFDAVVNLLAKVRKIISICRENKTEPQDVDRQYFISLVCNLLFTFVLMRQKDLDEEAKIARAKAFGIPPHQFEENLNPTPRLFWPKMGWGNSGFQESKYQHLLSHCLIFILRGEGLLEYIENQRDSPVDLPSAIHLKKLIFRPPMVLWIPPGIPARIKLGSAQKPDLNTLYFLSDWIEPDLIKAPARKNIFNYVHILEKDIKKISIALRIFGYLIQEFNAKDERLPAAMRHLLESLLKRFPCFDTHAQKKQPSEPSTEIGSNKILHKTVPPRAILNAQHQSSFPTQNAYMDHNALAMIMVVRGESTHRVLIEDRVVHIPAPEGSLFFYDGRIPHRTVFPPEGETLERRIYIENSLLPRVVNSLEMEKLFHRHIILVYHPPADLFKQMQSYFNHLARWSTDTELALTQLAGIQEILKNLLPARLPHGFALDHRIQTVFDYVEKNYRRELSLTGMANLLELSKNYFNHLFISQCGKSFNEYLKSHRMKQAKKLLESYKSRGMSIQEVALSVGYAQVRSFNRDFKKENKITPLRYSQSMVKTG